MKYEISNEPSLIQIGYWKEIEQSYKNAIAEIKEMIKCKEQRLTEDISEEEKTICFALANEDRIFLNLLEGEE